jgi:hypothetical protein
MARHRSATLRILVFLILSLFAVQFTGAKPAAGDQAAPTSKPAQPVPAKPAQKIAPAARQEAPATDEAAEGQSVQSDVEMQRQLLAAMRDQFTKEALDRIRYGSNRNSTALDRFMDAFVPLLVFVGVTAALLWILRTILDNRRWYRMVKVQTETHAKLLDRFGSSQDMLAYMQSEAGKKFLESPIFEGPRRQVSTLPFGRILWSVQIGVIAVFLGAGFLFLRGKVTPDADMGLQIFGTLILTLGIGFLVSGGLSYVLAKYFGLLEGRDVLAGREHNA